MTIGEKIKYFRKRIGITQAKLAELSEDLGEPMSGQPASAVADKYAQRGW